MDLDTNCDITLSQKLTIGADEIQEVLDKSMQTLGDQLYIKHTPIIQQEGN